MAGEQNTSTGSLKILQFGSTLRDKRHRHSWAVFWCGAPSRTHCRWRNLETSAGHCPSNPGTPRDSKVTRKRVLSREVENSAIINSQTSDWEFFLVVVLFTFHFFFSELGLGFSTFKSAYGTLCFCFFLVCARNFGRTSASVQRKVPEAFLALVPDLNEQLSTQTQTNVYFPFHQRGAWDSTFFSSLSHPLLLPLSLFLSPLLQ